MGRGKSTRGAGTPTSRGGRNDAEHVFSEEYAKNGVSRAYWWSKDARRGERRVVGREW